MANIAVAISGGIAAYKMAYVCSELSKKKHNVRVLMTKSATKFITPLSLATLTGNRVMTELFSTKEYEVEHIEVAEWADILLIAPATANIIGKIANGIADDLITTVVMATTKPIVVAPAMNTNMYNNNIVQSNISKLRKLNYNIIEPDKGYLACGAYGEGRLAKEEDIISVLEKELSAVSTNNNLLKGKKVLITAGPTVEPIDAVRYISNYSSGKMGYALAGWAVNMGAEVTLISGPVSITPPNNCKIINIKTADEMLRVVSEQLPLNDILIKAAAVADYKIKNRQKHKVKKTDFEIQLQLEQNTDILLHVSKIKNDKQMIVGFAAETNNIIEHAKSKILNKKLDLIVVNDVSKIDSGFNSDNNEVFVINYNGDVTHLDKDSKNNIAKKILEIVAVEYKHKMG